MHSTLLYRPTGANPPPLTCVAIDASRRSLACGTADSRVLLLDAKTGRPRRALIGHEDIVASVAFGGKSSIVYSAGWDGTVRRWSTGRSTQNTHTLSHTSAAKSLAVDVETGKGVAGFQDGTVKVFTISTLKCLRNIPAHSRDVSSVALLPGGENLLTASWDGTCRLWDLRRYKLIRTIAEFDQRIQSMAVLGDGSSVLLGLYNGKVIGVSIDANRAATIEAHRDVVGALTFLSHADTFASGGWDRMVHVWGPSRKQVASHRLPTGVTGMCVSEHEGRLYVSSFSGAVTALDLNEALPSGGH
ncbi:MAG: WD40 repeat domain-containing protein [Candidatus Thorarchaeota archaeon]